MPYLPIAFCAKCNQAMKISKTGVVLEVLSGTHSYYKIGADKYVCPNCQFEIYTGFGASMSNIEPPYKKLKAEIKVNL